MPGGGGSTDTPAPEGPANQDVGSEAGNETPSSTSNPPDNPYASPEYGDSPGIASPSPSPYEAGSSGDDFGSYGSGGQDEVMQDPWAGSQQETNGGDGGGFWGTLGDFLGGGDN